MRWKVLWGHWVFFFVSDFYCFCLYPKGNNDLVIREDVFIKEVNNSRSEVTEKAKEGTDQGPGGGSTIQKRSKTVT